MITNPIVVDMDVGTPQVVPMTISERNPISMEYSEAINVIVRPIDLQDKTVTPSDETQYITCDAPHTGLGTVTVNPIPSNYGLITYNGEYILVT